MGALPRLAGEPGWPELALARSIAAGGTGTSAPWWLILPEQFDGRVVLLAGLVRRAGAVLRDRIRWCRAVGVAYLALAVVFMVTGGKPNYLSVYLPAGGSRRPARGELGRACAPRRRAGLNRRAVAALLLPICRSYRCR